MQVLRGMKESLTKLRPKLILELKADALDNLGSSMEEALSFLHDQGYKRIHTLSFQVSVWAPDRAWKAVGRVPA